MRRRFQQVDVFGSGPFTGNPLAVVHDAHWLSTEQMQAFTRWENLSETTFLLPPSRREADYRLRIFTPAGELPFAGHPTLGSCHSWLEAGGLPTRSDRVVQECGAGLVEIRREDGGNLAFEAPPPIRIGPVDEDLWYRISQVVHVDPDCIRDIHWVDNGPGWIGVLLSDADSVLSAEPDLSLTEGEDALNIGLIGPYPNGSDCAFEVRALFTDDQGRSREDPVTGSLNASLAQWLLESGRAETPYTVSQGTVLGRHGRVFIEQDPAGSVWVGGKTMTSVDGWIDL